MALAQQPSWFSLGRETSPSEVHVSQLEYRLKRVGVTNVAASRPESLLPSYHGPTNHGVALSARVLRGAVRVGDPVVFMLFIGWSGGQTDESLVTTIKEWRLFDGFQEIPKRYLVENMVPAERHSVQPRISYPGQTQIETIPLEKVFEFRAAGIYRGTVLVRATRVVNLNGLAARHALADTNAFDIRANDYFFRVLSKEATDAELEAAETEIEQLTVKTAAESLRPRDRRSELEKRLATSRADQVRTGGASSADLSTNSAVESSPPLGDRSAGSLGLITNPLSLVGLALVVWMAFIVVRARRRVG